MWSSGLHHSVVCCVVHIHYLYLHGRSEPSWAINIAQLGYIDAVQKSWVKTGYGG